MPDIDKGTDPALPVFDLHYMMADAGAFPSRSESFRPAETADATLGMIHSFAGDVRRVLGSLADGEEFEIRDQRGASLQLTIGGRYGARDVHHINIPDLRGRFATGAGAVGTPPGALAVTWLIARLPADQWGFDQPGLLIPFAGDFAPPGWLIADGRVLDVAAEPRLFAAIGARFGSDGATTFALPDLRGKAVAGAGARDGAVPLTPGETIAAGADRPAALALHHLIATGGSFPAFERGRDIAHHMPFIGQIVATASEEVPRDWQRAEGQMRSRTYEALHATLGDRFGVTDTHFALPDLRGRLVRGSDGVPSPARKATAAELLANAAVRGKGRGAR